MSLAKITRSLQSQPRMIRTLLALVVCMTIGTLSLIAMQTDPIRSPLFEMAAVTRSAGDRLLDADVPIHEDRWQAIIRHTGSPRQNTAAVFHFIIDTEGNVVSTGLWRQQQVGRHTVGSGRHDWNARSIGVYVERGATGEFSQRQETTWLNLQRRLQDLCSIDDAFVYNVEQVR